MKSLTKGRGGRFCAFLIWNDENQLASARSFDIIQTQPGFEGKTAEETSQSLNIVMDSTGLKIYGEG